MEASPGTGNWPHEKSIKVFQVPLPSSSQLPAVLFLFLFLLRSPLLGLGSYSHYIPGLTIRFSPISFTPLPFSLPTVIISGYTVSIPYLSPNRPPSPFATQPKSNSRQKKLFAPPYRALDDGLRVYTFHSEHITVDLCIATLRNHAILGFEPPRALQPSISLRPRCGPTRWRHRLHECAREPRQGL